MEFFTTSQTALAAALLYVYGEDALLKIEPSEEKSGLKFTIDAPFFDCEAYAAEFASPEGLAISNLRVYMAGYIKFVQKLKDMRAHGGSTWASTAWINGRGN